MIKGFCNDVEDSILPGTYIYVGDPPLSFIFLLCHPHIPGGRSTLSPRCGYKYQSLLLQGVGISRLGQVGYGSGLLPPQVLLCPVTSRRWPSGMLGSFRERGRKVTNASWRAIPMLHLSRTSLRTAESFLHFPP